MDAQYLSSRANWSITQPRGGGISRTLSYVVVFFFIYSLQFKGSPAGLGTRVWLGVIGFFFLCYQAMMQWRRIELNRHCKMLLLSLLLIGVISIMSIVLNSTYDISFITYIPSMLIVAFAAFFAAQVIRYAFPKNPTDAAKKIFITVVVIQLSIALLMFLSPGVNKFLNELQIIQDIDMDRLIGSEEFRLSGFGTKFFGAGIINSYALILIASLIRTVNLSHLNRIYLALAFVFITSIGMMMSRTTMIGAGLCVVYLLFPSFQIGHLGHVLRRQLLAFSMSVLVLPFAMVVAVPIFAPKLAADIEPAIQFGFETFINYSQQGQFESKSTSQLLDMYDLETKLPIFIGDGYYDDPNYQGTYYMGIDVGYLRLIYYFGLPGLLAYLLFQYQVIRMSSVHLGLKEGRLFFVICLALVLFLNFKGFADIFFCSILIYAATLPLGNISRYRKFN